MVTMATPQGPNDLSDMTIDAAGFRLNCGGHVTPPTLNDKVAAMKGPPKMHPVYHYHKAATCLEPMRKNSQGIHSGGKTMITEYLIRLQIEWR